VTAASFGGYVYVPRLHRPAAQEGWTVSTVAGSGAVGHQDGCGAAATLISPSCAVLWPARRVLYICEQDRPQSTDLLSRQVATVHAGAPLRMPSGICTTDASGVLLVVDSLAGCVWRLDVESGGLTPYITADDILFCDQIARARARPDTSTNTRIHAHTARAGANVAARARGLVYHHLDEAAVSRLSKVHIR
jgi:hypothetical protein